jgi:hypothetical protein
LTDTTVDNDSVEKVLEHLRTTRASTASAVLAGRPTIAFDTGATGLQDVRTRMAPLDVGPYRIAYDELTAVLENDLKIAEAVARGGLTVAVRGVFKHYQLTGRRKVIRAAAAAAAAATVVAPIGVALTAALAGVPGMAAALVYYVKPLTMRVCPHGNFTISGRCRRPPCT